MEEVQMHLTEGNGAGRWGQWKTNETWHPLSREPKHKTNQSHCLILRRVIEFCTIRYPENSFNIKKINGGPTVSDWQTRLEQTKARRTRKVGDEKNTCLKTLGSL